ncbi:hypothetical protein ACIRQY_34650 [Streptomyces sp. NPDC101490]|uniref:hypothetical protein n=1 Tax=Streptomyces sp. NPDC101490 TaxID=3366143 RepID=UPI003803EBE8
MDVAHTAIMIMAISLGVLFSCMVGAVAFAVSRWDGAPVPACLATSGKAFAVTLTMLSAVSATALALIK